jgi:iron complex transport system substrate-binding protein
MRRFSSSALLLFACWLCAPHSIAQSAPRIVSLAPHITELLFAAGAGAQVVGALDYSDFPPAAKKIERVGDNRALDLERIAALKPDLVIAWPYGYGAGQIDALRRMGMHVEMSDPHRLEEIAADIERFGRYAHTESTALAAARAFRARLRELAQRYSQRSRLDVFYEIWSEPLYTLNGRHLVSQAIEVCGGRNVFAHLPVLAPTVSQEAVIAADPDVIVTATESSAPPAWLDDWRRWPQMRAVRRDGFVVLDADRMSQATPRMLDAVGELCAAMDRVRERPLQRGVK